MWDCLTNSLHIQESDKQDSHEWAKQHNECNIKAGTLGCLSFKSLPTFEQSRYRNDKLLKDVELSKARLRTYASYTPTDQQLHQLASNYRLNLRRNLQKENS